MNILIYGNMASGKTLLADLLTEHYRAKGQAVTRLDEEKAFSTLRNEFEMTRRKTEKMLERTLHNPAQHTIITTQGSPSMIYRFYDSVDEFDPKATVESLFDYYYHTLSKASKGILIRAE